MPIIVSQLVTWLNPGGIKRWLLFILKELDKKRVTMDFCCIGPNLGELGGQDQALGARLIHRPSGPALLISKGQTGRRI